MRVMLATIALNEEEWLPRLFEQHKDWPGLVGWCFVEGADPVFRNTNPSLVSAEGLSVDGTTEWLEEFKRHDYRIVGHHCRSVPEGGDQGKCFLRNQYLAYADMIKPDVIIQLDADEFYTKEDQQAISHLCVDHMSGRYGYSSMMLKQRHIWRPPYYSPEPARLFDQEVVGVNSYWGVPHTRIWRYIPGMRHVRNHNWPEVSGSYLTMGMLRCDLMDQKTMPQTVHMGYASSGANRAAKAEYYKARGEGQEGGRVGRKRQMYLQCRDAHLCWEPGHVLPGGAEVIPYDGPKPEVFR